MGEGSGERGSFDIHVGSRVPRWATMRWAAFLLLSLPLLAQEADPVKRLSDADPLVRAEAARELGRQGPKAVAAVPALEAALGDPDREVRRAAAWALERIRPPEKATDAATLGTQGKAFADEANTLYNKWVLDGENFTDDELDRLIDLLKKASECYGRAAELDENPAYSAPINRLAKKTGNAMLERDKRRFAKRQAERRAQPPVEQPPAEKPPAEKPPAEEPAESAPPPPREVAPADLVTKLRGARGPERFAVAEEIGKLGAGAAPALAEALMGEDRSAHAGVALALFRTGESSDAALFTLVSLLDEEAGPDLRLEAVQALGAIGPAAAPAVAGLVVALKDREARVRLAAAATLGRIGPGAKRASRALGDALRDADLEVRRQAAGALGEVGPAAAGGVPALLRGIGADTEMTRLCVQALGMIGPETKTIMPALEEQLKSANRDVREAAIRAVGNMGAEAKRAVPGLLNVVVVEQHEELRTAAMDALVNLGEEAVPDTAKALKDERAPMRLAACEILRRIGPRAGKAATALGATLKDKSPDVRAVAAGAIGALGAEGRSAVTAVAGLLKDPEWRVRVAAASALGGIGPEAKGAVKNLVAALTDGEAEVRAAAATALGRIGPAAKPAAPALEALKSDPSEPVRKAAESALSTLY
jgi:HEAT repeat protein